VEWSLCGREREREAEVRAAARFFLLAPRCYGAVLFFSLPTVGALAPTAHRARQTLVRDWQTKVVRGERWERSAGGWAAEANGRPTLLAPLTFSE